MIRRRLLGSLLCGAVLALASHSAAALDTSDSKVKAKATVSKIGTDGKQAVTITLDIEKGWYIYANPVAGPENYDNNRTRISVNAVEKVAAEFKYPIGKLKKDERFKEEYRIYENQVVIRGQVQRKSADAGPLQILIEVNACDKESCLKQGTIKLTVP